MSVESATDQVDKSVTDELFKHFKEIGCCDYCSLRFTGATQSKAFIGLKENDDAVDGIASKVQKVNACPTCLGLLQPPLPGEITHQIVKELEEGGYTARWFSVGVTLPACCQVREATLWRHLVTTFPDYWSKRFPFGSVTVSPKDVIKWIVVPPLEAATSLKYNPKSDFVINVSIQYKDNKKEISPLLKLVPGKLRRGGEGVLSRKAVDEALSNLTDSELREEFPVPPCPPDSYATLHQVTLAHGPVYLAGRYCKYSRQLSQTPWFVGEERRMESSVQELITLPIQRLFKSTECKFGAAGREDVDVRMVGRGRPFYVEVLQPRRCDATRAELADVEHQINLSATGRVSVRHLQIIPKGKLVDLKAGEEEKCKTYRALCCVATGYREALLGTKGPISLSQLTPLRVLHRRPVATRQRTVYSVSITFPSTPRPGPVPGSEVFFAQVRAQAGTYVKEFVHGDLGRTTPSLRSLSGAPFMDILALDVTEIELDWPPPIDYKCQSLNKSL